jgi:hypothetical protein
MASTASTYDTFEEIVYRRSWAVKCRNGELFNGPVKNRAFFRDEWAAISPALGRGVSFNVVSAISMDHAYALAHTHLAFLRDQKPQ